MKLAFPVNQRFYRVSDPTREPLTSLGAEIHAGEHPQDQSLSLREGPADE